MEKKQDLHDHECCGGYGNNEECCNNEHDGECCCSHEHDDELYEAPVFSLEDEEGNEVFFAYLDEVELDGKKYWVCQKVDVDQNEEVVQSLEDDQMDIFVFEAEDEDDGEGVSLSDIEDEQELQKVVDYWESTLEQEHE